MREGFAIFADGKDYVTQAYLCALSIRASKNHKPICLITNNKLSKKQQAVFDHVVDIPWYKKDKSSLKVNNRWKVYHVSPFEKTIVLDSDTLVLHNLDYFWKYLENFNLYFPSKVFTYRQEAVNELKNPYRKAFRANNLPNFYNAVHYFKKSQFSQEFYKWVELVTNNWELFYGHYCKEYYPKEPSMDVTVAIVSKILDCDTEITNYKQDIPNIVHMKPLIQNWNSTTSVWQDRVGAYLTEDLELKIGNHRQTTIFHYTENDFCKETIIQKYENKLCM
jgi:hypothetical protein